jgi:2-C-methyl-D-erythritol 4-phosphate cytidylyltransferase
MNLYVLIVAGGAEKRMGTAIPKQFLELDGKPVLMHTIARFKEFDESIKIITVLPGNQLKYWTELCKKYSFSIPQTLVTGGPTRYLSVKYGLQHVEEDSLVAIHDGVRPLVSKQTIKRCFDAAKKFGNAVPVISPADSLRMINEQGSVPVDRETVKIIQTPQVFNSGLIKKAYLRKYRADFTDDATVLEKAGESVHLVEGNRENIKITNPEDLIIAAALLHSIS